MVCKSRLRKENESIHKFLKIIPDAVFKTEQYMI